MYSTSPSSSSMASSSGRSSPEHSSQQPTSQSQRSNSFLLPQFFFSSTNNSNATANNAENGSHPVTNALLSQPPRRTSFGAGFSNSGRLSALSAFGFMSPSTGLSTSPPASVAGAAELSKRTGSAAGSPVSETLPAWSSSQQSGNTTSTASQVATTPAPPAKRHLCFPDGMGGTVCVEVKDRSRRGSSIN